MLVLPPLVCIVVSSVCVTAFIVYVVAYCCGGQGVAVLGRGVESLLVTLAVLVPGSISIDKFDAKNCFVLFHECR